MMTLLNQYKLTITINHSDDEEEEIEHPLSMRSYMIGATVRDYIREHPNATSFVFVVAKGR